MKLTRPLRDREPFRARFCRVSFEVQRYHVPVSLRLRARWHTTEVIRLMHEQIHGYNVKTIKYLQATKVLSFHPINHFDLASFLYLQPLIYFSPLLAASCGVISWRDIESKFRSFIAFAIMSPLLVEV